MAYLILAVTFMITFGILAANYELERTKQKRRETLRKRARRCV